LHSYLEWLFPCGITAKLNSAIGASSADAMLGSLQQLLNSLFNVRAMRYGAYQSDGLFGYFAVMGLIYLIWRWNSRVLLPALWFVFTFLYLGIGTLSLSRYIPIGIAYPRLMLLYIPAMALIMGFAASNALEPWDAEPRNYLSAGLLALLAVFLFINSFLIIQYIGLSEYAYADPLLQVSRFVSTLPANAVVYAPNDLPLAIYTDYRYDFLSMPTIGTDCGGLRGGSYVVMNHNARIENVCGLEKLFAPESSSAMEQYDLFSNSIFGFYYNVTVYHRR
jgi:hypothetical protein